MAKIIWMTRAEQHVAEIEAYITEQDCAERAMRTAAKIYDAPERLRKNPELGSFVPRFKGAGLKEIRVFKWRIIFSRSKDKQIIYIRAVWHGARRLRKEDIGEIER